jgi:hypothetical protein
MAFRLANQTAMIPSWGTRASGSCPKEVDLTHDQWALGIPSSKRVFSIRSRRYSMSFIVPLSNEVSSESCKTRGNRLEVKSRQEKTPQHESRREEEPFRAESIRYSHIGSRQVRIVSSLKNGRYWESTLLHLHNRYDSHYHPY